MDNYEREQLKKYGKNLWSLYVELDSRMRGLKEEIQNLNLFIGQDDEE